MLRLLPILMVAICLVLFTGVAVSAQDKDAGDTHEGKVVKVADGKLTMVDKDGKNEHTHTLAPDAKITVDGKDAKLTDITKDMMVKVTTKKDDKKVAIRIEAKSK